LLLRLVRLRIFGLRLFRGLWSLGRGYGLALLVDLDALLFVELVGLVWLNLRCSELLDEVGVDEFGGEEGEGGEVEGGEEEGDAHWPVGETGDEEVGEEGDEISQLRGAVVGREGEAVLLAEVAGDHLGKGSSTQRQEGQPTLERMPTPKAKKRT
jgi:hypothetical protein